MTPAVRHARLVASLRRAWLAAEERFRRTGRGWRQACAARARYLTARDGEGAMSLEEVAARAALVPSEYRDAGVVEMELHGEGVEGFELEAPEEIEPAPADLQANLFD